MHEIDVVKLFFNMAYIYYDFMNTPKYDFIHRHILSKKLNKLKNRFFDCSVFEASRRVLICIYGIYGSAISYSIVNNHLLMIKPDNDDTEYTFSIQYLTFNTNLGNFTYDGYRQCIQIVTPEIQFTVNEYNPKPPRVAKDKWNSICGIVKKKYCKLLVYALDHIGDSNMNNADTGDELNGLGSQYVH